MFIAEWVRIDRATSPRSLNIEMKQVQFDETSLLVTPKTTFLDIILNIEYNTERFDWVR